MITFGKSLKNYPAYPDLTTPDANCEPDYTAALTQTLFLSIIDGSYNTGVAKPKVLESTSSDNLFMYFASDSGFDTVRLDGAKNLLYGYSSMKSANPDLFKSILQAYLLSLSIPHFDVMLLMHCLSFLTFLHKE